ncbi:hypothetical protein J7E70_33625 [Variovorax paradoxus]|nr:hypothetical protein [Variovorax paradoxus]MBT2305342.1 hypothetical protein [Variovorax paradoxus]
MMKVFNSNIEGTMIVIPGLSRSLDTVGKRVVSPQQTFSERMDLLAAAGQRRTIRLREAQRWLG